MTEQLHQVGVLVDPYEPRVERHRVVDQNARCARSVDPDRRTAYLVVDLDVFLAVVVQFQRIGQQHAIFGLCVLDALAQLQDVVRNRDLAGGRTVMDHRHIRRG